MSHHTMLPVLTHPWIATSGQGLPVRPGPGLSPSAIDSLRTTFPGRLTAEHEQLLDRCCGIDGTPLRFVDFTGQWHDEETFAVFRPCITLAVDPAGRRWIAETGNNTEGLPGPVWCVVKEPEVAVYVCEGVGEFLDLLYRHTVANSFEAWSQAVDAAASRTWRQRGALAFQSRQACGHDQNVRAWLLQLPRDSRVYDLRSPSFGVGWPYGVAGGMGRFHRCGRELLFAVSGFPAPSRWTEHLGTLAQQHVAPRPGILASDRGQVVRVSADSQSKGVRGERMCA
jgi:hypothetical protein